VVTPQGVAKCDVAIKGETIAAVAAPGALADASATELPSGRFGDKKEAAKRSGLYYLLALKGIRK
jgi:hypothetical protein